jgi:RNA polymerase sigma-70 factor (ECF subfamily)
VPSRPGAWLLTTARRAALDRLRRARRADARADALAHETGLTAPDETPDVTDPAAIPDDRLRLIFTCCHPALSDDGRVALTLRLVGGLTTPEIARAFLVPDATIAQRLVRAKRTIREREIPYEVPEADELRLRLPAVLAVIYLVFNEGYAAHTGEALVRDDLCVEAIRLGGMLAGLMPDEPEVLGLLALMELQASRALTRVDAVGDLVLLADQDRTRWDRGRIERGVACLERGAPLARAGSYQLQASIAACHARAASWEATDWQRIVALYDRLAALAPSPVVALNRAAAIGMAGGPATGLTALDALDDEALRDYHWLPAARAEFLRRLERWTEAAAQYRAALALVENASERRFLAARLAECERR